MTKKYQKEADKKGCDFHFWARGFKKIKSNDELGLNFFVSNENNY